MPNPIYHIYTVYFHTNYYIKIGLIPHYKPCRLLLDFDSPMAEHRPLECDHHLHYLDLKESRVLRAEEDVQWRPVRRYLASEQVNILSLGAVIQS